LPSKKEKGRGRRREGAITADFALGGKATKGKKDEFCRSMGRNAARFFAIGREKKRRERNSMPSRTIDQKEKKGCCTGGKKGEKGHPVGGRGERKKDYQLHL